MEYHNCLLIRSILKIIIVSSKKKVFLPLVIVSTIGIIGIIGIVFLSKSVININSGHVGVEWRRFDGGFVIDEPPLSEGVHFIAPWNKVIEYNVRNQEYFDKMIVLSSDGKEITLEISVWYHPKINSIANLHQEVGENYLFRLIQPHLRSLSRSVFGRYTFEQLENNRDLIQQEIFLELKKNLEKKHIEILEVLIRDINSSK